MKTMKMLILGVAAVALASCGGGDEGKAISSKEDAAKVVQRLSSTGAAFQPSPSGSGQKFFDFETSGETSVDGKSGSAKIKYTMKLSTTGTVSNVDYVLDILFSDFSSDEKNTYDGTEKLTYKIDAATSGSTSTAKVAMKIEADLKMTGEYAGDVKANVTMTVDASSVTATSGSVTMVLDGTITADGTTYTYNNETITVSATAD